MLVIMQVPLSTAKGKSKRIQSETALMEKYENDQLKCPMLAKLRIYWETSDELYVKFSFKKIITISKRYKKT